MLEEEHSNLLYCPVGLYSSQVQIYLYIMNIMALPQGPHICSNVNYLSAPTYLFF